MAFLMVLFVIVGMFLAIDALSKSYIFSTIFKLSKTGTIAVSALLISSCFIFIFSEISGLICGLAGVLLLVLPLLTKKDLPDVMYIVVGGLAVVVAVFMIMISVSQESERKTYETMEQLDNAFNKDPNTWTKSEEESVNSFLEWQAKNY